jgi:transcriptional regulator with XRE-family HTH domain
MAGVTRDGNGRFERTAETAARDAEAARLRSRGLTYRQIAEQLGMAGPGKAHEAVKRVLAETVGEAAEDLRLVELERLDQMYQATLKVLEAEHYAVSHGKVIYLDGSSEPLTDNGPVLQAVDRLLKIQERRAKLLGLDAPTKANVTVSDAMTEEISRLAAQLGIGEDAPEAAKS